MRKFLSIKEVLGRPKSDNFIVNTERCFKCVYCWNSTLQNKTTKDEQKAEDKMFEVSEVYLQAPPIRGSIRLCRLRKVKYF